MKACCSSGLRFPRSRARAARVWACCMWPVSVRAFRACSRACTCILVRLKGWATSSFWSAMATISPEGLGFFPHRILSLAARVSSFSLVPGGTDNVSASFFLGIFNFFVFTLLTSVALLFIL